jgi:hypothetical protein
MTPEDWQRVKPILAKEFKSIGSRSEFWWPLLTES